MNKIERLRLTINLLKILFMAGLLGVVYILIVAALYAGSGTTLFGEDTTPEEARLVLEKTGLEIFDPASKPVVCRTTLDGTGTTAVYGIAFKTMVAGTLYEGVVCRTASDAVVISNQDDDPFDLIENTETGRSWFILWIGDAPKGDGLVLENIRI